MACNQATGINSILGYLVIILKQGGLTAQRATQADLTVKLLNCCMTIVAVMLVDKKGRKFLLSLGTAGIIVALSSAALLFHSFEVKRSDVRDAVQAQVQGGRLSLPIQAIAGNASSDAMSLTVLYSYGSGDKIATALTTEGNATLSIQDRKSVV